VPDADEAGLVVDLHDGVVGVAHRLWAVALELAQVEVGRVESAQQEQVPGGLLAVVV
jgi:hypothetical protein